jgi:hypothetical protein
MLDINYFKRETLFIIFVFSIQHSWAHNAYKRIDKYLNASTNEWFSIFSEYLKS